MAFAKESTRSFGRRTRTTAPSNAVVPLKAFIEKVTGPGQTKNATLAEQDGFERHRKAETGNVLLGLFGLTRYRLWTGRHK